MFILTSNHSPIANSVTATIHISSLRNFLIIGDFVQLGSKYNSNVGEIIDILPIQSIPIGELSDHDYVYWSTHLGNTYNMCLVKIQRPVNKIPNLFC